MIIKGVKDKKKIWESGKCVLIGSVIKYNHKCSGCELCNQWCCSVIEPENEHDWPIWLARKGPIITI